MEQQQEKPQKYNNKFAVVHPDGAITKGLSRKEVDALKPKLPVGCIVFDSQDEMKFYTEVLLPHVRQGLITVELQPKYVLLDGFTTKTGIKHLPITYSPDFKVTYPSGRIVCVDVKGFQDQKFPIKRKLFDARYPNIELVVMKRVVKFGGWISDKQYKQEKAKENKAKKGVLAK